MPRMPEEPRALRGAAIVTGGASGLGAACLKHSLPGDFNLVAREEVEALVSQAGFHVRR